MYSLQKECNYPVMVPVPVKVMHVPKHLEAEVAYANHPMQTLNMCRLSSTFVQSPKNPIHNGSRARRFICRQLSTIIIHHYVL